MPRPGPYINHPLQLAHALVTAGGVSDRGRMAAVVGSPPAGWPLKSKQDCLDWAKQVAERLPPASDHLQLTFEASFALRS